LSTTATKKTSMAGTMPGHDDGSRMPLARFYGCAPS
jgi:hypothetical protein